MKIFNIMLSRDLGGIQQSFLDYSEALKIEGFKVINITSLGAKINQSVPGACKLPNLGPWDFVSRLILKILIFLKKPDLIIVHGNRAIKFSLGAKVKIVGIAHNYSVRLLKKCDYVIALTDHMRKYLIEEGFSQERIEIVPNMIRINAEPKRNFANNPIVIGAMGRFVPKKGMDVFLRTLALLKEKNIEFKAVLGGEGDEAPYLKGLTESLGLKNLVTFPGWVRDKDAFFASIDIFCLPSLSEPFGIIVLDAMARKVPVLATKSEGPSEIIENGIDGLLCSIFSPESLAEQLSLLIQNPDLRANYSREAYRKILENYEITVPAKKIKKFISTIIDV